MNFGTSLLALLVLGGAGYGAYRYFDDSNLSARLPGQSPEKWKFVKAMSRSKRYVVFIEAAGPKGFEPVPISSDARSTTNSIEEAKDVLSKTALDLTDEAKGVLEGRVHRDALRGITSQRVGIYDTLMNRIVEKYDIRIKKAK